MFDALIRDVSSRYGLGADQAGSVLRWVLTYVFREHPGGLTGLLEQFKKAGLGDVVSSWVGGASPGEIAPERVETVLGADTVGRLASAVGLGKSVVLPVLSFLLPKLIGLLTKDGMPAGIPAAVGTYLAATAPLAAREPEPNPLRWLWWLLIPILALLLWRWCGTPPTPAVTPVPVPVEAPTPTPVPTPVADALPATVFFTLAETTLDAEDGAKVAAVADYLKANADVKVDVTGYADKAGTRETNLEVAKARAKSVREALRSAGIAESRINMKPPMFVTGSGTDTEARRVEIHEAS